MTTILLCGYRRSGKSTFRDILLKRSNLPYALYFRGNAVEYQKLKFSKGVYKYYSFSSILKQEVAKINNISIQELEEQKEKYRSQLVETAKNIRLDDKNFYVDNLIKIMNKNENNIIDDFRYKNELRRLYEERFNCITVRIINENAIIPNPGAREEHNLNDILTDYVVLTDKTQLSYLYTLYPQYKKYDLISVSLT